MGRHSHSPALALLAAVALLVLIFAASGPASAQCPGGACPRPSLAALPPAPPAAVPPSPAGYPAYRQPAPIGFRAAPARQIRSRPLRIFRR